MKRLMMSAVRDAHLKSILNVPVIGSGQTRRRPHGPDLSLPRNSGISFTIEDSTLSLS